MGRDGAAQYGELLYVDKSTGKRLGRGGIPRLPSGVPHFMSMGDLATSTESVASWESIHGRLPERHQMTGAVELEALVRTTRKAASQPYISQVVEIAKTLSDCTPTLEVGGGTCHMSLSLAHQFNISPYAIDVSSMAVESARQTFLHTGFDPDRVSVADVVDLPFQDDTFHLIFGKTVFEHFEKPNEAAGEISRVAVPGGYVILDVPNERNAYWTLASERVRGHTHTTNVYTIEEFSGFFIREGFEICRTWGDALFYTTPYILLRSLIPSRPRPSDETRRTLEPTQSEQGLAAHAPPLLRFLWMAIASLDGVFKRISLMINRCFNKWGWTNSRNGVLIGIVARKTEGSG